MSDRITISVLPADLRARVVGEVATLSDEQVAASIIMAFRELHRHDMALLTYFTDYVECLRAAESIRRERERKGAAIAGACLGSVVE